MHILSQPSNRITNHLENGEPVNDFRLSMGELEGLTA